MRIRPFIATALIASAWLGACSRLAAPPAQESDRHILLSNPPGPESGVVSDIESGRAAKAVSARIGERRKAREAMMAKALAPTGHQDAVISEAAPIHTMSMTMAPTTALPLAVEPEPATQSSGSGWRGRDFGGAPTVQALGGNRGPAIIIRGGPGGRDDDCDLRNALHPRGGGTAVNRLAPPLGGGYGRSGGGIR